MAEWLRLPTTAVEHNRQNNQCQQERETVSSGERIVKIMRMQAMGTGIDKAHLHVFCRIVRGVMIVALVMRVAVHMTMRGSRVRMRSMCLVG
jgi:hypothetical protein